MLVCRRNPEVLIFLLVCTGFAEDVPPSVVSVTVPGTSLQVNLATQVGRPYDAKTVEKDVRYLWGLGRFDDIRVEAARHAEGVAVVFRASVTPHLFLHEVRIQPNTYGLDLKVPEATPVTPLSAHRIALDAQRQLNQEGYQGARIRYLLAPAAHGEVDLKLTVDIGDAIRVKEVRFEGDSRLRGNLQALRIRRMLPGVPFLWSGWRLLPSYSQEAIDADVAHLHSLYVGKGFFDARVRPGAVDLQGKDARVSIVANPGPHYDLDPGLCPSLFSQRRESQGRGALDFKVKLDAGHLDIGAVIERGRPYRVGRLEFEGSHHYRDGTIRANFLLDEGDVFDEHLLRKSIARLNRAMLFENIDAKSVVVQPDEKTGFADVTVHLKERKRGSWNLSGPVGPMSLAGPLEASIGTRLPAWGRGLLELSTCTASIGMFAFAHPLLPILNAPKRFTPILLLQRPFTPAGGWKTGFTVAPQLGGRNLGIGYAATQLQQRLLPLVAGERGIEPDLNVTVLREDGDAEMVCQAPKPRMGPLRAAGTIGLHLLGTVPGI